jgi:glutathione S-transferase
MITLYHFADDWGFDPSPFCLKLETYLKLARVPFEKRTSLVAFMRAPKKKLPYIVDDGQVVDDSEGVIEYLKRNYSVSLDGWLTPAQRATGHAVRRMLEDGTYWILIYSRWMENKNWRSYRPVLLVRYRAHCNLSWPSLCGEIISGDFTVWDCRVMAAMRFMPYAPMILRACLYCSVTMSFSSATRSRRSMR